MSGSSAVICLRRNSPGTSLGKILLNPPWETSYLFSYENKARNRFHGLRARFCAHLGFAQAQASEQSPIGVVYP